jgi:hypothetical protein
MTDLARRLRPPGRDQVARVADESRAPQAERRP